VFSRQHKKLCRYFGAALAATRSQYGATSTGAHSVAETMLLSPTTIVGLVSFLAHDGSKTISRIAIALIAKAEHIAPHNSP
jgi:hypothetical protein